MNSFWRKLMAKKPAATLSATPALNADFARSLLAGLQESLVADQQQEARNNIPRAYAVLSPVVPLPPASQAGWFGGVPRLPKGVNWPTIDGEPGRFVCQIDLTALPQNMWNGVGPRSGWLAIFMHPHLTKPAVLHVTGHLFPRLDGVAQGDAVWFRPNGALSDAKHLWSPEWPIDIASRVGPLPMTAGYKKGFALVFPDPRKGEVFDFANPAMMPFDLATIEALLKSIEGEIDYTSKVITGLTTKQLTQPDSAAIAHCSTLVAAILAEVAEVRRKIAGVTAPVDMRAVSTLLQNLAALQVPTVKYLDTDKDKNAVINVQFCGLGASLALDQPRWPCWQRGYLTLLYQLTTKLYLADPACLPPAHKTRLEAILAFEAAYEHGAMGHASTGHLHTPYGPGTPTEVLLELPTSNLVGWCWGDMYKVAFFINRDRLEMGRFDGVTAEITN